MNTIETIRTKIERYKQEAAIARFDNAGENADYFQGKVDLCDDLTHILDTLPEQEHPIYALNQILLDWVREAKTDKEQEARFEAHKRFFELYDEYMVQEPEQPAGDGLEEEIKRYMKEEMPVVLDSDLNDIARHFAEWGAEHAKK